MRAKIINSLFSIILAVGVIVGCFGCGMSGTPDTATDSGGVGDRPETFSQDEYVLYQNIFYNGYGGDYDGKPVEKEGVFAVISDAYNDRQRYYVWGYYDQTRCCDWQWEFVPEDGEELPPVGSLVKVSGTFASDSDALDGYWIRDAKCELETDYSGQTADLDMAAMSCTLERVQMINIMNKKESFQDREFTAYGRIASLDSLEDPYYDNSWQIKFTWDGDIPAIGTLVLITGTVKDGTLTIRSLKNM